MSKQAKKQINNIAELADIGFFIKLTHQVLGVKQVTQYEIERMLLISKESSTLATMMTAFLCPTAMRGSLYLKPLMTYEVWTVILSKKLDSWYNAFMKFQNKIQVFLKYGIEPLFWEVVGEQNPLLTAEFHTLPFVKKAWILKTLCTTIFHSNKKIEEYFNSVEDFKLRGNVIYEDTKFLYVNEFSPEIRVYRIVKHEGDYNDLVKELIPGRINCENYNPQEDNINIFSTLSRKPKFCLIAYDRETLEMLTTTFSRKKKSVSAVDKLLSNEQNMKLSLKGLKSMYLQWKKFIGRMPLVVEISRNYWINKVTSQSQNLLNPEEMDSISNDSSLIIFGKRPSKRKFTFQEIHSSSSNDEKLSEESISDWEDGNIRRSKRIRRSKTFPRQWERRYEDAIYETYSRSNHIEPRTSYNFSTSRITGTELSNPNDYVRFLQYQQQKMNSFYNMKRNGLTIRKTFINPTKKSIVSAAVENANKQFVKSEEETTPESKVLMISMGGSASESTSVNNSDSGVNSAISISSITPPEIENSAIYNLNSTPVNTRVSPTSQPPTVTSFTASEIPSPNSSAPDVNLNNQSASSMVETFLSEWMTAKKTADNDIAIFPSTSTPMKAEFPDGFQLCNDVNVKEF